ncbi:L-histidine N(alpha)-methyltransferase [Aphanothece hegewaldii CCALA 016]|uniref:L-histidine N(Alpha)-methyltransferase n=1 Tax=Aphanothece hegewaldii CCALA 016 TaxID=2107694 RepID=A0A2T1LYG4_9CHRO|nr:L-histidine N(alpha)-methyltransferase [Aphanothece hegewaldii]PSF37442.1 L-histidine N(alpha)-methyltransferase [Aphanothece hegewaldii CCALA 016]
MSLLKDNNYLNTRLQIKYIQEFVDFSDDGSEVIKGLNQQHKTLPPRYFYDAKGSLLFEQICTLSEYYPTRTETEILQKYGVEIAQQTGKCELIELGSGSSTKTRLLLDAYKTLDYPLSYVPIDISMTILEDSAKQLLNDYSSLQIKGIVGTYEVALQSLPPSLFPARMMLFLGSTLGNLKETECDRFFSQITSALKSGDYFLLGIDLQKPIDILEAAYNDRQGITAAFNLNMLNHLNQRFQGNFDPNLFKHWAFYNTQENQIEMHLICKKSHKVRLEALDLTVTFQEGETIQTEISRKFNLSQMEQYLENQGLKPLQSWTDPQKWFGLILCQCL